MQEFIFTILFILIAVSGFAEKSKQEIRGDKHFERFAYPRAIKQYTAADSLTTEGKRNFALSHTYTADYHSAAGVFSKFIHSDEVRNEDYFQFASVLRILGNDTEADYWMEKFYSVEPEDLRAIHFVTNRHNIGKQERYNITHLEGNSDQQDFGAVFYENKIVFASSRNQSRPVRRLYNRNEQLFLDLYISDYHNGELNNIRQFNKGINHKMHEGPVFFSHDGKFMAFTRNNYTSESEDGIVHLEIYFSEKDSLGSWGKPYSFRLNNPEYSVGHPWLSKDGKTMIFASNMPGGYGGVDLYRIKRTASGEWGEAENLGKSINTEGDEMFPFYDEKNGWLFFSSNGHFGFGGLDVFVSKMDHEENFYGVKNAGGQLNSRYDDFALVMHPDNLWGFFASNRPGGKGDDDIYRFDLLESFHFGKVINGTAKDDEGKLLAGTHVSLTNRLGNIIHQTLTDENGFYRFVVDENEIFSLIGDKNEYIEFTQKIDLSEIKDGITVNPILNKVSNIVVSILITDKKTDQPLEGVRVQIYDIKTKTLVDSYITSITGLHRISLSDITTGERLNYTIQLEKSGYLSKKTQVIHTITDQKEIKLHEFIDLSMSKLEVGSDLAKLINLDPIYFDLGSFRIRRDAADVLDKIVEIMNQYPNMVIELGSHTDCRGTMESNQILSENRAKSSANYIKQRITNPNRISGKGYGETRLLNDCACEGNITSNCTEDQHQQNRRTEFVVIKVE